jgi:hypothetical protein
VHFNSALGTGGSLALPIAGRTLKQIEASATLRRKYVREFTIPIDHETELDCAARRQPSALERLIEDAFGPRSPRDRDTSEADRRNIFDRLFKKKE